VTVSASAFSFLLNMVLTVHSYLLLSK